MRREYKKKPWICSVDGCSNPGYARTWCKNHYMRWRRIGSPVPPPKPKCAFDPCDRESKSAGLCPSHYMQVYLGKELTPIRDRVVVSSSGLIQCKECNKWKPKDDYHVKPQGYLVSRRCKHCYNERSKILQQARKKRMSQAA